MRISYLNGEFKRHEDCLVSIEDRGFQFAEGAYEVSLFENGKLIDGDLHVNRMIRSLNELRIDHDFSKKDLLNIQHELFRRNNLKSGICYMQITRGAFKRIPNFPSNSKPTITASVSVFNKLTDDEFNKGISVITLEDIRWLRCDIKSTNLIASTMANQKARDMGFDDAIFIRKGYVTEATYANVFIVDSDNRILTRAPDNLILTGITRNRIIELLKNAGMEVEERDIKLEEMMTAKEVFLTSTSYIVRPVFKINDQIICEKNKQPAFQIAHSVRKLYQNFCSSLSECRL